VSHPLYRLFVGLILAPFIALSGALAPEHLHESDADHPHAIAHRHLESHQPAAHDQDGAELDHGDGQIVWLQDVRAYQPTSELPLPESVLVKCLELVPDITRWIATSINDTAPPHGPPRLSQSLRAPPISAL
jgi:hypothetical protein